MAKKAEDNAKRYGAVGYHFPAESAFSGSDVSPNTCVGVEGTKGML